MLRLPRGKDYPRLRLGNRARRPVGKRPILPKTEFSSPREKYGLRKLSELEPLREQSKLRPVRPPKPSLDEFYSALLSTGLPDVARSPPRRLLFETVSSINSSLSTREESYFGKKSPGFQRAVIPKIAACKTWWRLYKKIVPKYLFGFDSACTSYFYRSIGRLYPQRSQAGYVPRAAIIGLSDALIKGSEIKQPSCTSAAAPLADGMYYRECACFELMVRAVGVVTAERMGAFNSTACVSIILGLGKTGIRDQPLLTRWEEVCAKKIQVMDCKDLAALATGMGHLSYTASDGFMSAYCARLENVLGKFVLFDLVMLIKGLTLMMKNRSGHDTLGHAENSEVAARGSSRFPGLGSAGHQVATPPVLQESHSAVIAWSTATSSLVYALLERAQQKLTLKSGRNSTLALAPFSLASSWTYLVSSDTMEHLDTPEAQNSLNLGLCAIPAGWLDWYESFLLTMLSRRVWKLKPIEICTLLEDIALIMNTEDRQGEVAHVLPTRNLKALAASVCGAAPFTFAQKPVDGETASRTVFALMSMNHVPRPEFSAALKRNTLKSMPEMSGSQIANLCEGLYRWGAFPSSLTDPWLASMFILTRARLHECSNKQLHIMLTALRSAFLEPPRVWLHALLREICTRHVRNMHGTPTIDDPKTAFNLLQLVPSSRKLLLQGLQRSGDAGSSSHLTVAECRMLIKLMLS